MGTKGSLSETWKGNDDIVEQTSDIIWDDTADAHLHQADLGFIAQAGYRFSTQKELKISYSQSLANIDPNKELIKNNVITVSFVYHHQPKYTRYRVR